MSENKSMNIPDIAVEAAAKAMWRRVRVDPWENNTDHLSSEIHRAEARLALEAALPYLVEPVADQLLKMAEREERLLSDGLQYKQDRTSAAAHAKAWRTAARLIKKLAS